MCREPSIAIYVLCFLLDALFLRSFQFASESHQHLHCCDKKKQKTPLIQVWRMLPQIFPPLTESGVGEALGWVLQSASLGLVDKKKKTLKREVKGGITLASDRPVWHVSCGTCGSNSVLTTILCGPQTLRNMDVVAKRFEPDYCYGLNSWIRIKQPVVLRL